MNFERMPSDIQLELFFQLIDNTLADKTERSDIIRKYVYLMNHGAPHLFYWNSNQLFLRYCFSPPYFLNICHEIVEITNTFKILTTFACKG